VQINGHHYHNEDKQKPRVGIQFVRETLADGLLGRLDDVPVMAGPLAGKLVPPADLGIGHPVIVSSSPISIERVAGLVLPGAEGAAESAANAAAAGGAAATPSMRPGMRPPGGPMGPGGPVGSGGVGAMGEGTPLRRYDFILQFAWVPVVPGAPKPAVDGENAAAGN
jgi:hypothetical protein